MAPRTGAERYFAKQMEDPDYRLAHREALKRIRKTDALVRSLDERRSVAGLSKAALARKAGLPPEAVRRLFTVRSPNPTAGTLVALAEALDLEVVAKPKAKTKSVTKRGSRLTGAQRVSKGAATKSSKAVRATYKAPASATRGRARSVSS